MTQSRGLQGLALSLVLSAIFTYALLYATYSLPLVADRLLQRVFPDYPFEEWPEAVESLVPYGYLALAVVVALIVLGLVSRATYLGWGPWAYTCQYSGTSLWPCSSWLV